ncbi:class I SAM-dependent methyltransferase [Natronomonas salsuginis]|uniref:Methyltransferase domain-containing protein n=1 Tax=Natronomonas salsuginis TaxID=2217661 RepID=A0A4U5JEK4_9EURY|nr:methyltransferase domain-containing protein [Natronomonas salsuginis]TKR24429.1 methyltransferase domain-containing protein [Natronomonas salsuginis]
MKTDSDQWDAELYDASHSYVYEYGKDVLQLLKPRGGEQILDLGCGTGHLTAQIAEEGAEVIGLDSSREMVTTAKENHPALPVVLGDARSVEFSVPFDAVFSNAALHWMKNQRTIAHNVFCHLTDGGRFVAEFGGNGNVNAIQSAVRSVCRARGYEVTSPWYFPTPAEHASILESAGFEIRYMRLIDRPTPLEDGLDPWLKMFADGLLEEVPRKERGSIRAAVINRLRDELYDPENGWVVDYRRLRFVAHRS